ncbi:MAG: hypothetical protein A2X49_09150 [Lentisphaerae bacterium GWF2_52_8]|nr:MAG: hypothetical protein A2X49_09150 [Lentisphaerae bacterium GWF2_52_8]
MPSGTEHARHFAQEYDTILLCQMLDSLQTDDNIQASIPKFELLHRTELQLGHILPKSSFGHLQRFLTQIRTKKLARLAEKRKTHASAAGHIQNNSVANKRPAMTVAPVKITPSGGG